MAMDPNKVRNSVKKWLAAFAGTVAVVATAKATLPIPAAIAPWLNKLIELTTALGVWAGILGASPLGRIIWKDDPADPPAPPVAPPKA
jgi:hypothetical protein